MDDQSGCLSFREPRLLANSQPLFGPVEFGRDKQIYVNALVVVEIDRVGKLGEFFSARSRATPERIPGRVVILPVARAERQEVALQSLRVLRAERVPELPEG